MTGPIEQDGLRTTNVAFAEIFAGETSIDLDRLMDLRADQDKAYAQRARPILEKRAKMLKREGFFPIRPAIDDNDHPTTTSLLHILTRDSLENPHQNDEYYLTPEGKLVRYTRILKTDGDRVKLNRLEDTTDAEVTFLTKYALARMIGITRPRIRTTVPSNNGRHP
jgi:hypothetical protein